LIGKPERKRPLGRPRRRWKDNTTMDLKEIVWEDVEWMHLAEDRGQWRVVESDTEPFGSINGGEFLH
jgi:hypothetical protein